MMKLDKKIEHAFCKKFQRNHVDGSVVECDLVIYFKITGYSPGCSGTHTQPACGPELDFEFLRVEFDGEHDDSPEALTQSEINGLRQWFENNHAKVYELVLTENLLDEHAAFDCDALLDYQQENRRLERIAGYCSN